MDRERKLDESLYALYADAADVHGPTKATATTNARPDANPYDTAHWEQRYRAELELREHRGTFADGYTDDDIDHVLTRITRATGVRLVCVWNTYDDAGFGGHSELYVHGTGDTVHELGGDLGDWLGCDPHDPDAPAHSGDPQHWQGVRADFTLADLPVNQGHNWSRRDDS